MADKRPLLAYLKIQEGWEKELLFTLKRAQAASTRDITRLASIPGIGAGIRGEQLTLAKKALLQEQAKLWDVVGGSVQAARANAAAAAIDTAFLYDDMLLRQAMSPAQREALLRAAQVQARLNVDAVTSRVMGFSKFPLSQQVYKTKAWSNDLLQNRINAGIARGLSSREIAASVKDLINPNTPGGVKYAAQRLGRTEINNAFHATSARHYQKTPWVTGVQWVLSGSHPRPDECNEYAEDSHYPGGDAGVFLPMDLPAKPHPNCLCYTISVTASEEQFMDEFSAGAYDEYIDDVMRGAGYPARKNGKLIDMVAGGSGTGLDPVAGQILAARRTAAGLSRKQVAQAANTTEAKLYRMERKGATDTEIAQISDALDLLTGVKKAPAAAQAAQTAGVQATAQVQQLSGTYLKTRREAAGVSRKQLAQESGITEAKIARIELKGGTDAEYTAIDDALTRLKAPGMKPAEPPKPKVQAYGRNYPTPEDAPPVVLKPADLRTRRERARLTRPQVARQSGLSVAKVARIETTGGTAAEMQAIDQALTALRAPGVRAPSTRPQIDISDINKSLADDLANNVIVYADSETEPFLAALRVWTQTTTAPQGAWGRQSVTQFMEGVTYDDFLGGVRAYVRNPAEFTGTGRGYQMVRSFMEVLEASPANRTTLYRGMHNVDPEVWKLYKVKGKQVNAPPSSWTESLDTARTYANQPSVPLPADVTPLQEVYNIVFRLPSGETKAMDITSLKGNSWASDKEWIAGGRLQIVDTVESQRIVNGIVHNNLEVRLEAVDKITAGAGKTPIRNGTLTPEIIKEIHKTKVRVGSNYEAYGRDHLAAVYEVYGVQGLPTVGTAADLAAEVAKGGTRMYRSVSAAGRKTAERIQMEFIEGDIHWAGNGVYGNGTYAAVNSGASYGYGSHQIEMVVKANAKVFEYRYQGRNGYSTDVTQDRYSEYTRWSEKYTDDAREAQRNGDMGWDEARTQQQIAGDPSVWALLHGYDVVKVAGGNGDCDYYVILNREAVIVSKDIKRNRNW